MSIINTSNNLFGQTELEKAETLKKELDSLRPLDPEAEGRIIQKLRLDWNYHSNNLEGNSLDYGETKALLLFGITSRSKPFKDYAEMKGHNEAINWAIDLIKDGTPLTENFIRELHTLLLEESEYKEAVTPDGKPTRKKIEVGKYKTLPNHVLTVTDEIFYFASPEETPAKMYELVQWFRDEKEKQSINPIILAALFHYRFIRIHPFDDGNGRVARILMNFILMQFHYPPVIIKTEDKENYYRVLRLADADQIQLFIEYIAQNLVRSLEIMIRGAKGESIEEPEDLDKGLALLEQRVRNLGKKVEVTLSPEITRKLLETSISKTVDLFIEAGKKFKPFYLNTRFQLFLNEKSVLGEFDNVIHYTKEEMNNSPSTEYREIKIVYLYETFNQDALGSFDYRSTIEFKFDTASYTVFGYEGLSRNGSEDSISTRKLYNEELSEEEIQSVIKFLLEKHMGFIEKKVSLYENASKGSSKRLS